jgi:hypothetical protein
MLQKRLMKTATRRVMINFLAKVLLMEIFMGLQVLMQQTGKALAWTPK